MQMKDKWLLRASAVWTIYVWSVLIKNMLKDREHSIRFRLVHIGLGVVSTSFAVATWKIAASNRPMKGQSAASRGSD